MQRVIVMGPPGSGKSTFARHLGTILNLPVFHLDQAFHLPGWVPVEPDVFSAEVERISALPSWVIDGNYIGTIAPRYRTADTVIYLDVSSLLSMFRVLRRIVMGRRRVRPDAAAGCPERLDLEFLGFVWRWNRDYHAELKVLIEGFAGEKFILHGSRQQRHFLQEALGRG